MKGQGNSTERKVHVLIVDDEPRLADLFGAWLEPNWAVTTAYDGEQALEKVNESIDVVLLDRRMPGLSGDEVLSLLRAGGYDCSVIIVSATDPASELSGAEFNEYLVKPISKSQLLEKIEVVSSQTGTESVQSPSETIDSTVN